MGNEIWVLAEQQDGKVKRIAFELLSAGIEFSKKTGQEVAVILLGSALQEAVKVLTPFADKIYCVDHPNLTSYTSETYLMDIAPLVKEYQPSILLGGGRLPPAKTSFPDWPCISRQVISLTAPV